MYSLILIFVRKPFKNLKKSASGCSVNEIYTGQTHGLITFYKLLI